jgi:hypothetical protein
MAETALHQFFRRVLPECNAPPQASCCDSSTQACGKSFGYAITPTPFHAAAPVEQSRQIVVHFPTRGALRRREITLGMHGEPHQNTDRIVRRRGNGRGMICLNVPVPRTF